MEIKERMHRLLNELNHGAYEREEAIALTLLSAFAGESIFLLGLPGVGKSMMARRLKYAFKDSSSFEYLMSRFSTPDEIFGPVSISKLKDGDTYERVVDGYLPTADIVFLDEIWKAGPAIQNSLLTVLNERIFRNGKQDMQLPLKAIISASNELPAEGEGLEALWDRFLVRYVVEPIKMSYHFVDLITDTRSAKSPDASLAFSADELQQLQKKSKDIIIPDHVLNVIVEIHDALSTAFFSYQEEEGADSDTPPYVSDRRWKKIMNILRTSALLNGRGQVDLSDCCLLEHLLWDKDKQLHEVRKLVASAIMRCITKSVNFSEQNKSITEMVGEFISPDNKHFVFLAGEEEVRIRHTDYVSLTSKPERGTISDENIVELSPSGPMMIRVLSEGSITINNFTYQLRRSSTLRNGSATDLLVSMKGTISHKVEIFHEQMRQNIFLRDVSKYTELKVAQQSSSNKIDKLMH